MTSPGPNGRLCRPLDGYDADLTGWVLSWLPYGGPPADEAWELFGMTPARALTYVLLLAREVRCRRRTFESGQLTERLVRDADNLERLLLGIHQHGSAGGRSRDGEIVVPLVPAQDEHGRAHDR